MAYQKKKDELIDLRIKEKQAREELSELQDKQRISKHKLSKIYDMYVQKQAERKAGQCSQKDVEQAEKDYLSLKGELSNLDNDIQVAERVLSMHTEEVVDADKAFNGCTLPYYEKKVDPHFVKIQRALDTIDAEIEAINSYQRDMQRDNVPKHILRGITHYSQPVITKNKKSSFALKDFIKKFEVQ